MAFDQSTRNRLQRFVSDARTLLTEAFTRQLQHEYGMNPATGEVAELSILAHLDDTRRETWRLLSGTLSHYLVTSPSGRQKEALERIVREQAFTILNRLVALRMMEARGFLIESVSKGYQSRGFQLYQRLAGSALGETGDTYRCYLFSLFDEFALDLTVLFDRFSPQGRLFPRESALLGLLSLINHPEIEPLWAEDETIGWIYQYFNTQEERRQMRAESAAPRNSRELAVRNQFFTPRYVVEFLTDNTLGRIWYEMTQGNTALKDRCRYLVRCPYEIFLQPGEEAPEQGEVQEGLSQEDLLQQPVYIPFRPLKDPRDITMLDPACGSMHVGLYAFDLYEKIYDEAWELECQVGAANFSRSQELKPLRDTYENKDTFLRDVPRLIVEYNVHGIDIDPRAVQISVLSLWLRAQKSWQGQDLKPQQRPQIQRSNIVCAEPMPGEKELLKEFTASIQPRVLGQLVERIFDQMQLAGEAGSLLKIEEEIQGTIEQAREAFNRELLRRKEAQGFLIPEVAPEQEPTLFDFADLPDRTHFWSRAEQEILAALKAYSEQAEGTQATQKRLFVQDTVKGFAFIDICRQKYDAVLMNPPFGDASQPSKPYLDETYGDTKGDVYKAFIERFQARLVPAGYLGIISSRAGFFLRQSADWRKRVVLRLFRPIALADLGMGVLDAMVEVAAYVLRNLSEPETRDLTLSLVPVLKNVVLDRMEHFSLPKWQAARNGLKRHQAVAELENLEAAGFIERCPGEVVRYTPVWTSVKSISTPPETSYPPLVCIRALADEDKETAVAEAISVVGKPRIFVCNPSSFSSVPGTPFAYWAGDALRFLFKKFTPLEAEGRDVQSGVSTMDDFRFLRLHWEIEAESQGRTRDETKGEKRWVPLAKGGAFSQYYIDWELVIDWASDGSSLKTHVANYRGMKGWGFHWAAAINGHSEYFRPGLTWPRRTQGGLSVRVMAAGSIFGDKGPAIFVPGNSSIQLSQLLAVTNSLPFRVLVSIQMAFGSYEVGVLERTPIPNLNNDEGEKLAKLGHQAWASKRSLDAINSVSHAFVLPAQLAMFGSTLKERAAAWAVRVCKTEETVAAMQAEIDELAFHLYGIDNVNRFALTMTCATKPTPSLEPEVAKDEESESATADTFRLSADLLAYVLGIAFGRWDIRFATGEKPAPESPDPFAPLPVCPPGQLQNEQGLPITKEDTTRLKEEGRWHYPIEIPWGGILVDDSGHPLDFESRLRQALQIIWNDRWEVIEREACEILGVRALRDYFRKPAGFFADHLKHYSKSRRKAPIYWPLQTLSGSYTLWLYYHRLNDQTLYTCVNDFVEKSKLREVTEQLHVLRAQTSRSKQEEKELERLQDFEQELKDFRDELLRVAKFWKPNLNDGVQITAAPLWKLFQHKPWRKKLKETWDRLENGDYDWAHLAYSIWPNRVREKCKHDKSLAIAHGLEELYEEPPESPRKRRRRNQG